MSTWKIDMTEVLASTFWASIEIISSERRDTNWRPWIALSSGLALGSSTHSLKINALRANFDPLIIRGLFRLSIWRGVPKGEGFL